MYMSMSGKRASFSVTSPQSQVLIEAFALVRTITLAIKEFRLFGPSCAYWFGAPFWAEALWAYCLDSFQQGLNLALSLASEYCPDSFRQGLTEALLLTSLGG